MRGRQTESGKDNAAGGKHRRSTDQVTASGSSSPLSCAGTTARSSWRELLFCHSSQVAASICTKGPRRMRVGVWLLWATLLLYRALGFPCEHIPTWHPTSVTAGGPCIIADGDPYIPSDL